MDFWYQMLSLIKSAGSILVIFGGIAGIFVAILFSISVIQNIGRKEVKADEQTGETEERTDNSETEKNTKKTRVPDNSKPKKVRSPGSQVAAILFATVVACLLMVPVGSAFNNLVAEKLKRTVIDEESARVRAARAEVERRKAQNIRRLLEKEEKEKLKTIVMQDITIVELNNRIKLLEGAQMRVQSFQNIRELVLLETDIKETTVRREALPKINQSSSYTDEMLAVIVHDITAKFGVDTDKIKVAKLSDDTVIVSGIHAIFIGTTKNEPHTSISEIRRNNLNRDGVVTSTNVLNTGSNVELAASLTETYKSSFSSDLNERKKLKYMDDAVVLLARNFLVLILDNLYSQIIFDERELPGALPLMEFLQKEVEDIRKVQINLMDIKDNPLLVLLPPEEQIDITFTQHIPADMLVFDIDTLNSMQDLLGRHTQDFDFEFIEGEDGFYTEEEMDDSPAGTTIKATVYADNDNIITGTRWTMSGSETVAAGEYRNIISLLSDELGRPAGHDDTVMYWEPRGMIIAVQHDGDVNVTVRADN